MKKTLILLLAALLAASCVEPLSPWHGGDGPIAFAVTADGGTKALDVTTGNVAAFDCSAYPAATTAATQTMTKLFIALLLLFYFLPYNI